MKLLLSCLLNKAPAGTIYHDSREQVTDVHKLTEGVPQGGAMSIALFNMDQSVAIRPVAILVKNVQPRLQKHAEDYAPFLLTHMKYDSLLLLRC